MRRAPIDNPAKELEEMVGVDQSKQEVEPDDKEFTAARQFLTKDGATCGELGVKEMTVTWGKETFQPVQFNFIEIGPISVTLQPRPDEPVNQVYRRAYDMVDRYAKQQFAVKVNEHLERIKQVAVLTAAARKRNADE